MRNFALVTISFLFLLQTIAATIVNHKMVRTMRYQAAVIERQKLVIQRQYQYLVRSHCSVKCYDCGGPVEMEQ